MKRSVLVASLVLGVLAISPACAQSGGMGGGGYGGFGDRPDYGGPMRPRRAVVPEADGRLRELGRMCVTARGACQTRPRPSGSSCSCRLPGSGPRRGVVR